MGDGLNSKISLSPSVMAVLGNLWLYRSTYGVRWFPSPLPSPGGRGNSSRTRCEHSSALDPSPRGERFSLSPRERAGVRGERSRLDRFDVPVSESVAAVRPKGYLALIHSFSHASGFAGDRRPVPTPLRIMSVAFGGQATCKRQGPPQTAAAFRPSNPRSPSRRRR